MVPQWRNIAAPWSEAESGLHQCPRGETLAAPTTSDRAAPVDFATTLMTEFTHFDAQGQARMVDVGAKGETHRVAVAEGRIVMQAKTLKLVETGGHAKGDVLGIARVAGILGAKKTADLVPLCHPLPLHKMEIKFTLESHTSSIRCEAVAETTGRTGVEMEALNAVQVSLLTIYDMCKAVDRGMTIETVRLIEKRGGKSGHWQRTG